MFLKNCKEEKKTAQLHHHWQYSQWDKEFMLQQVTSQAACGKHDVSRWVEALFKIVATNVLPKNPYKKVLGS